MFWKQFVGTLSYGMKVHGYVYLELDCVLLQCSEIKAQSLRRTRDDMQVLELAFKATEVDVKNLVNT